MQDDVAQVPVVKVHTFDTPSAESNVSQEYEESSKYFGEAGAIDPPVSLRALLRVFEHSNALRQNVDAYATNIDGFGHRFEPVIDLDSGEANQRIAHAIYLERLRNAERGELGEVPAIPTDEEVALRRKQLVSDMRVERSQLTNFFEFCCADMSFTTLRRQVRQDIETLGNAYVEVLRDGNNDIAEFVYVPAFTVRLLPLGKERIETTRRVRISDLAYENQTQKKRFRLFVQVHENCVTYFKEFDDPRVISRKTGRVVSGKFEDEDDGPATELLHFRVHTSRSPYGLPRWLGALKGVMGSMEAEEVNLSYFSNKSVPPLALMVSGGHVTDATVKRIETHIREEIKGKQNFHKILVLEASPSQTAALDSSARTSIDLKPLTQAQQKDGLFQEYDQNNQDKVGMAFRLPRMLRGDIRDFNRSTAEAALDFAEQQVFGPERGEFDFMMNRKIMPDMGVRYWKFKSNAPAMRDTEMVAKIIRDLTAVGILTPEEARQLAEQVFNKEFARLDEDWTKQPISLTLAGIPWERSTHLTPFTGEPPGIGQARAGYGDRDADGITDEEVQEATALPSANVTPTTLSNVLTVNEVRLSNGFGPKKLDDGTEDPMGNLVIADYVEQMRARRGVPTPSPSAQGISAQVHRLLSLRKGLVEHEAREAALAAYARRKKDLEEGAPDA